MWLKVDSDTETKSEGRVSIDTPPRRRRLFQAPYDILR